MKTNFFQIITSLGLLLLWGCYPEGPNYAEDLDIVITNYNPGYNFSAKKTYAMPDKIVKITGNLVEGDRPSFIPDVTASSILSRIESNMTAMGWTKTDISDSAHIDVLLVPAAWETTTISYYYDYWYWWYGGYYPYWGWGYYPPVSYTSYSTGTLIWTMIDTKEVAGDGNAINQWTGAINGILTGNYNSSRVNKAIDKAFAQSPYLSTK
jgi:hypothetical protein